MFGKPDFPSPFRSWIRHVASVPKGFLRYQIMEFLSEKPFSGSEIINEMEKQTNGQWRPSPGSVYPLLAWLQDNGYIREVPTDESGIKRYTLTDKGKQFLEEQRKIRVQFNGKMKFFAPPFSIMWRNLPEEKAVELRKSSIKLLRAFASIGASATEKFSEQAFDDILRIINEAAEKLEEIDRRLKGG
jgi:DNA-binding PadR family transcriptional regulator